MSRSVECLCVGPDLAQNFWPHARDMIRDALRRGGGDFKSVEDDVLCGRSLLWIAWDGDEILACAVTEIAGFNDLKICTIIACGGRHWGRFGHLIGVLESYASAENCDAMRIVGRKGWSRALPDYRVRQFVFEKELH